MSITTYDNTLIVENSVQGVFKRSDNPNQMLGTISSEVGLPTGKYKVECFVNDVLFDSQIFYIKWAKTLC